jgi:hypothetical protein
MSEMVIRVDIAITHTHMTATFRKRLGVTPSELRRKTDRE